MFIIVFELREIPIYIQERGLTLTKFRLKTLKLKTISSKVKNDNGNNVFLKTHLSKHITPFCKFLRLHGLDEIPQFFNVLAGQMSIVGPRPLSVQDIELLKKENISLYNARNTFNCKPGITGLWQIYGNRHEGFPNLIYWDQRYNNKNSLLTDIGIIIRSIPFVSKNNNRDAILFTDYK